MPNQPLYTLTDRCAITENGSGPPHTKRFGLLTWVSGFRRFAPI